MSIDYIFWADYAEHEIKRLGKVVGGLREDIDRMDVEMKFLTGAIDGGSPRAHIYTKQLIEKEGKKNEAVVKMAFVLPRFEKLKEQLQVLSEIVKNS